MRETRRMIPDTFPAFVAERQDGEVVRGVRAFAAADLGDGDVTVRIAYSSVNYKDALASVPDGKVARVSPLIPGIDLAGTVVEGPGTGDEVLVHGYDLGMSHHGGFAAYARVPTDWVVPLPAGLSARDAMAIGTAGFTAALSVARLEEHGLTPGAGPVLVTGATGGVGSVAVGILARRGYEVIASTGKADAHDELRTLGASEVVGREEVVGDDRPLGRERWAGAVDCVGGPLLAGILKALRYGAAVAASGNTAGPALDTTVLPFILRGVALLGIDSARYPIGPRRDLWDRLAGELRPLALQTREIGLADLDAALTAILAGEARGRTLVEIEG